MLVEPVFGLNVVLRSGGLGIADLVVGSLADSLKKIIGRAIFKKYHDDVFKAWYLSG
jgi:hypothetical protein